MHSTTPPSPSAPSSQVTRQSMSSAPPSYTTTYALHDHDTLYPVPHAPQPHHPRLTRTSQSHGGVGTGAGSRNGTQSRQPTARRSASSIRHPSTRAHSSRAPHTERWDSTTSRPFFSTTSTPSVSASHSFSPARVLGSWHDRVVGASLCILSSMRCVVPRHRAVSTRHVSQHFL
jgi:hypothetical protein